MQSCLFCYSLCSQLYLALSLYCKVISGAQLGFVRVRAGLCFSLSSVACCMEGGFYWVSVPGWSRVSRFAATHLKQGPISFLLSWSHICKGIFFHLCINTSSKGDNKVTASAPTNNSAGGKYRPRTGRGVYEV